MLEKILRQQKIDEVALESPAEKSGLKKNDIIVSIDKNKVESILEVSTYINTASSDKINIKVLRNQKEITVITEPIIVEAKDAFGNSVKKIIGVKIAPINDQFNKKIKALPKQYTTRLRRLGLYQKRL